MNLNGKKGVGQAQREKILKLAEELGYQGSAGAQQPVQRVSYDRIIGLVIGDIRNPFYADRVVYFRSTSNNGYSGDLEMALIPEWFRTDILQEEKDSNGVLIERSDITESVYFALLFEFDGDQKAIRHVMYNCTASRPTIESQTKESSIEPGTETLSITADPREDGLVKSRTGDETTTATYNNWYKNVYVPSATTGGTGGSTSGT